MICLITIVGRLSAHFDHSPFKKSSPFRMSFSPRRGVGYCRLNGGIEQRTHAKTANHARHAEHAFRKGDAVVCTKLQQLALLYQMCLPNCGASNVFLEWLLLWTAVTTTKTTKLPLPARKETVWFPTIEKCMNEYWLLISVSCVDATVYDYGVWDGDVICNVYSMNS